MNPLPKCFRMSRKFYGILILAQKGLVAPILASLTTAPTWVTQSLLCAQALILVAIELSELNEA
ncbi:hypothetical protein ACAW74_25780 [Fibrella sp. WM1]|uniref:hypothetical protein n=1 Tax=Fibrella musci TaxID=3242485 RepID=UPI0035205023